MHFQSLDTILLVDQNILGIPNPPCIGDINIQHLNHSLISANDTLNDINSYAKIFL